jgi:hypothetical protein
MLAQIDDINQSFLCALWLRSPHEQQKTMLNTIQTLDIKQYNVTRAMTV